jgi:hypothetical protein
MSLIICIYWPLDISIIKWRKIWWSGHVTRKGGEDKSIPNFSRKPWRNIPHRKHGSGNGIILKLILNEWGVWLLTGFRWRRSGHSGGLLWARCELSCSMEGLNFLIRCGTISYSRRTWLHRIASSGNLVLWLRKSIWRILLIIPVEQLRKAEQILTSIVRLERQSVAYISTCESSNCCYFCVQAV